jgi:hypothetical protein
VTRRTRTATSAVLAGLGAAALVTACSPGPGDAPSPTPAVERCAAALPSQALPVDGVAVGVNPDWGSETLTEFTESTGIEPAAAVSFSTVPSTRPTSRTCGPPPSRWPGRVACWC